MTVVSGVEYGATELVRSVTDLAEGVFAHVEALADVLGGVFRTAPGGAVRVADLAPLEAPVRQLIGDTDGIVVGAGFVAAPRALVDAPFWLQWWTSDTPGGPVTPLVVETDERAEGFRDYTQLPWFAVPARTGGRHLTGPYVDYLCTDEYSLTFTAPVSGPRGLVGVAGADVYVRHVERRLLPGMRAVARTLPAAGTRAPAVGLVNSDGRVVCGSTADLVTGALVRELRNAPAGPSTPGTVLHPCPGTSLAVLVRPGAGVPAQG